MLSATGRLFLVPEERRAEAEAEADVEFEVEPEDVPEVDSAVDAESRPNSLDCGIGEINHLKNMNATANVTTNSMVDVSMALGCATMERIKIPESGSPVTNSRASILQIAVH